MEWFNTDIGSAQPTFQQRPEILKGVGMHRSVNVSNRVIDYLMGVLANQTFIGKQLIGVESGASLDTLLNFLLHNLLATVLDNNGFDSAAPLHKTNDSSFSLAASSSDAAFLLGNVHVAGFAADEGFVYFDLTAELLQERSSAHSQAETVHHEPSRLLSDAKVARHFATTDSILAVDEKPESSHPLIHSE